MAPSAGTVNRSGKVKLAIGRHSAILDLTEGSIQLLKSGADHLASSSAASQIPSILADYCAYC